MVKVNGTWGGAPCGKSSVLFPFLALSFPIRTVYMWRPVPTAVRVGPPTYATEGKEPRICTRRCICGGRSRLLQGLAPTDMATRKEKGKIWECQLARFSVIVRERWGETCVSGWQRRRTGRNMFGRGMEAGQDGQNRTKAERYIPYRGLGKSGGIGRTQYSSDAQAGRCVVGALWEKYRGWR